MIALALLLAAADPSCVPVVGAAPVLADPRTTWLFVGETHGTAETPAIFGDLVCAASLERKVVVAIEQNPDEQPAIDAYLASDGGDVARATFLRARIWTNRLKDGRSSQAMLALIERLRLLKASGRIAGVRGFQALGDERAGENYDARINRGMADQLTRIAADNPSALVIVLTGSVHASKDSIDFGGGAIVPAAARLPAARTVSILAEGDGGTAWICGSLESCGPTPWQSNARGPRGLVVKSRPLIDGRKQGGKFDGTVDVGVPFTASPPAVPLPEPAK